MKRYVGSTIALVVVLALAFTGLRVYGFYHNERVEALNRAEAARNEAKSLESLAEEEELRIKCNLAWSEYDLEKLEAENVRLELGDLAYLKAQKKLIDKKPLCSGYAMSTSDVLRLGMEKLEHVTKAIDLRAYAEVQTGYAADRKQQTKRLLHNIWASLTGQKD